MGRGWKVAESTSSVGRGTAGLLLMKGTLPLDEGEGPGEPCRVLKCHGKKGDGDTSAEIGGESCGGIAEA